MTLRQAQHTPGPYGRLTEPWTPQSTEPLQFELVEVLADRTIIDPGMDR